MRSFILSLSALWLATSLAGEPLIPERLNAVLSEIRPEMKKEAVMRVLATAYPDVIAQPGDWSGQTGYIDFRLDDRYRISVAAKFDAKREEVVHDDLLIYIFDQAKKHRIEFRQYWWEKNEKKANQPPDPTAPSGRGSS